MPEAKRSTRCMGCHKWIWQFGRYVVVGIYDYHPDCAPEVP